MSNDTREALTPSQSKPTNHVARQTKGRRAPVRDGEQLISAVKQALIESDQSVTYETIVELLEAGCDHFPASEHLTRVVDMLKEWSESPRLAAGLCIRARLRPRRPNAQRSVAQEVCDRLYRLLEGKVGYPRFQGNSTPEQQAEREAQLKSWFDEFVDTRAFIREDEHKSYQSPPVPFEYAALACLVNEPKVPAELIYRLLDAAAEPAHSPASASGLSAETAGLLRQLQRSAFGAAGVPKRLRDGLDWVAPARLLVRSRAEECATLKDQLQWRARAYAQQQERSQACEAAERHAQEQIVELKSALAEAQAASARSAERLSEREDHWRISAENQLARVLSTLRERLQHELDEVFFALSDSTPHLKMAMRRLQRAREIVAEMEQSS